MLTRAAVYASKGVAASSQPLAVSAGLWALRNGGSFADAAIAASAVLCVVEPWASQLGGDAFIVLYDAKKRQTLALNASGAAPRQAHPDRFPDGIPLRGLSAATVPGLVDAWFTLHGLYGTQPVARLLEPAIDYAQNGYPASPRKANIWRQAQRTPELKAILPALLHRQTAPGAGSTLRCPDTAWCLRQIAQGGRDAFYKGEIADRLIRYSRENNGLFEPEDFAAHRTDTLEPLKVEYRGYTVHGQPPVSQGIILLEALKIIEDYDLKTLSLPDRLHVTVEAVKCAFADRWAVLGDPKAVQNPMEKMLSKEFAQQRKNAIDMKRAQTVPASGFNEHDTTYFCIADEQGNAISFIQSVYHPFGCGVVAEGTGVLFNNRMRGFSLNPKSQNRLQPRKRPIHTLNAYLITKDDRLSYVSGTPGGDVQVQTNLQIVNQLIDFRQNPQAAIEQPRWAWQPRNSTEPSEGNLLVEIPVEQAQEWQNACEELKRRGHQVQTVPIGGHPSTVQIIQRTNDAYAAGSDPRSEGQAAGY